MRGNTPARKVGFLVILGLLAGPGTGLSAHPHVWADVKAEVAIQAGYVEGVWAIWTFDEIFSQLILEDNDPTGTGTIDDQMSASIRKTYFDNLKAYAYYSHLQLGTKPLAVPQPTQFRASLVPGGRVQYRFFLPLAVRMSPQTPLGVAFYDETFFTDMVFDRNQPVRLQVTAGGKAKMAIRPDKSKTYYGGMVTPVFVFINWES
jgi:ABC-type uncharacterized transport system substrate-binding protein